MHYGGIQINPFTYTQPLADVNIITYCGAVVHSSSTF